MGPPWPRLYQPDDYVEGQAYDLKNFEKIPREQLHHTIQPQRSA